MTIIVRIVWCRICFWCRRSLSLWCVIIRCRCRFVDRSILIRICVYIRRWSLFVLSIVVIGIRFCSGSRCSWGSWVRSGRRCFIYPSIVIIPRINYRSLSGHRVFNFSFFTYRSIVGWRNDLFHCSSRACVGGSRICCFLICNS